MKMLSRNPLIGVVVVSAASLGAPAVATAATTVTGTAATRTVLTVSSATTPTPAGQQVYLRATVTAVSAGAAATGTVTFLDGTRILGSAVLAADAHGTQVARTHSAFAVGVHSLSARYVGNLTYAASQSLPTMLTVAKAASRVVMTENAGAKVGTFDVVAALKPVAAGTGLVATGTATFTVDALAPQGFALNAKGRAHLTLSLGKGSHTAHVAYSGDANLAGSAGSLSFTVA